MKWPNEVGAPLSPLHAVRIKFTIEKTKLLLETSGALGHAENDNMSATNLGSKALEKEPLCKDSESWHADDS